MEEVPEEISVDDLDQFLCQLNTESIKEFCTLYRKDAPGRSLRAPANYALFCKCLNDTITKHGKPTDLLLQKLFNRFKISDVRLDILDFLLTMTLLARIIYEKKLILIF